MVPKNLITFLVLLWTMHHYRAKRIIKAKYRETKVVNYRQITMTLIPYQLVHFLTAMSIEWTTMDK